MVNSAYCAPLGESALVRWLLGSLITAILLLFSGAALADTNYGAGTYGACEFGSCSLTISSSGSVNLDTTPTASGVCTIKSDSVSVLTDNSAGYTLTFADTTTSSALTSGSYTIAVSSGTAASPATLAANRWGYRVDSVGTFGSGPTSAQTNGSFSPLSFAGVPNSTQLSDTLATTSAAADPAVITTIWYGVCADLSTTSGNYSTQVTYTAIAN